MKLNKENKCIFIGLFRLTKTLHEWNGTVGDKFMNALLFVAFIVIPVYEVAIFIDGITLNTIKFWTGDSPITMTENDKDVQIIKKDGVKYHITATQNKFSIEQVQGKNKGKTAELIFNPENKTWNLKDDNKKLCAIVETLTTNSTIGAQK